VKWQVGHGLYGISTKVALVALLLLVALLYVVQSERAMYPDRLIATEECLRSARLWVSSFRQDMGRFPESFEEVYRYQDSTSGKEGNRYVFVEQISTPKVLPERTELDGTGGFFYNRQTGEIRVNLTRPLRTYWRLYYGRRRDEIPASW
jgi:hypothetical protein